MMMLMQRFVAMFAMSLLPTTFSFSIIMSISSPPTTFPPKASTSSTIPIQNQIQTAMELSKQAQVNITAAHEAADLWSLILVDAPSSSPSTTITSNNTATKTILENPSIRIICNALYASTLIRIGRDERAIQVYDDILHIITNTDNVGKDEMTMITYGETILKKGDSLQRLMRYEDALGTFASLVSSSSSAFFSLVDKDENQNRTSPLAS